MIGATWINARIALLESHNPTGKFASREDYVKTIREAKAEYARDDAPPARASSIADAPSPRVSYADAIGNQLHDTSTCATPVRVDLLQDILQEELGTSSGARTGGLTERLSPICDAFAAAALVGDSGLLSFIERYTLYIYIYIYIYIYL